MTHRFGAALLAAAVLAGCASRDVPLDLPSVSLDRPVAGGNGRHVVVVFPFADERADPGRCGMRTNVFDQDSADAVCRSAPNEWLAAILAAELRASGFTVLRAVDEAPAGTLRIEGTLLQFFVESLRPGTVEADLSVRLHVTSANGLDATRTFFDKGWKRAMTAGSGGYQLSVRRASGAILEEMVTAILELMNEYPQLGRNEHDEPVRS